MNRSVLFASVVLTSLAWAASLSAATFTWNGSVKNGPDLNVWTAKQNWDLNSVAPTAADDAVFSTVVAGSSLIPTIASAASIRSITFNANADPFNIQGAGTLTVGTGGIINNVGNGKTETFSVSAVALSGTPTVFTTAASGTTLFTGTTLSLGANNLTIDGAGTTQIGNQITGGGALTKSGAGSLTLSGNNSYSGATVVNDGALNVGSASAFGASSGVSIGAATLNLNANVNRPAMPVGLGAGAVLNQGTSSSTFGALTVSGNSTINLGASGSLTFETASRSGGLLTISGWSGPAYEANVLNPGGATPGIFVTQSPAETFLANVQFVGNGLNGTFPVGARWLDTSGELVPVPEPSTYAIVFGLGLVGFAIARRRMTATA